MARFILHLRSTYTNRIIGARDFSSVQISVAEVDEKTGRVTGDTKKYALSGFVRAMVNKFYSSPVKTMCSPTTL